MKKFVLAILPLLILISCEEDGVSPVKSDYDSEVLIPLKLGNTWETIRKEFDSDGQVTRQTEAEIFLVDKKNIGGKEHYFTVDYISQKDTIWDTFSNDSFGSHLGQLFGEAHINALKLKYPCSEGDNYDLVTTAGIGKVTIESVRESITVGAGTFDCIKYKHEIMVDSFGEVIYNRGFTWASPGIGIIKTESTTADQEEGPYHKFSEVELVSFSIK
jgi:hypothetical protein